MDNQLQLYQAQFIQEIVPVVVALAFMAMVILEVVKKFKEVIR